VVRALAAVLVCAVVVACASSQRGMKSEAPPPPAENDGGNQLLPASKKQQIEQLEAAIAADRAKLELPEPSAADYVNTQPEPMGTTPAIQNPSCKPAKTEKCTTSCTLSDSICTNADSICRIAVDLNDDWSRGRCARANKTCEGARDKCCGCQ